MHRPIRRMVMGLLFGWLAAGAAPAQYNYQNYLLGDRAAGMGGAAVASADGVDACYYNPAGLAQMRGNSLSLSGSLYGKQAYRSQDGMFPGEDARYDSFVTIPTTVGGVWKVRERLTLAFSVLVPDRMAYNELRSFRDNTHVYNYSAEEQVLWFGPSAAWQVDDRLSCGVSLYAVHSSYNENLSLLYEESNLAYARGIESRSWGVLAAAGVQYQLFDRLRLGAKLQAPSLHLTGSGKGHAHMVTREETISVHAEEMGGETRVPAQVSLGAAWGVPRAYMLAADVNYYHGDGFDLRYWQEEGERQVVRVDRSNVFNFNLGLEYYLSGIFPLRTGFFTNFSAAPSVEVDNRDHSLRMDAYGISASVGREQGHLAANIGVIYVFGSGRSLGWDTEDDQVVNAVTRANQENIYLVVNTAYLF